MTDHERALRVLAHGELTVEGRVLAASNLTLYARVDTGEDAMPCVYKPVSGERPLWDFPDGTLAAREVASYELARLAGWDLVPPTVLRDGPLGPGMCQQWVVTEEADPLVDVVVADPGAGWISVLEGQDGSGRPVRLVHRDDADLRRLALLDAVLNNADRKGGHVLRTAQGTLVGVDHGLCFHVEPKLRTVLWGWAGQVLGPDERTALERVLGDLGHDETLPRLLTGAEVDATRQRVQDLLESGRMPFPSRTRPAVPWPAM